MAVGEWDDRLIIIGREIRGFGSSGRNRKFVCNEGIWYQKGIRWRPCEPHTTTKRYRATRTLRNQCRDLGASCGVIAGVCTAEFRAGDKGDFHCVREALEIYRAEEIGRELVFVFEVGIGSTGNRRAYKFRCKCSGGITIHRSDFIHIISAKNDLPTHAHVVIAKIVCGIPKRGGPGDCNATFCSTHSSGLVLCLCSKHVPTLGPREFFPETNMHIVQANVDVPLCLILCRRYACSDTNTVLQIGVQITEGFNLCRCTHLKPLLNNLEYENEEM